MTDQNMNLEFVIVSLPAFFLALGTSLLITPLTRNYLIMRKLHGRKNSRTVHKKVLTRMGGAAIYSGITVSLVLLFIIGKLHPELSALFTGMTLIFVTGLIDDVKGLTAYIKLAAQLTACLIIIRAEFRIRALTVRFADKHPDPSCCKLYFGVLLITKAKYMYIFK